LELRRTVLSPGVIVIVGGELDDGLAVAVTPAFGIACARSIAA
jgi:hypothetical protein